MVLVGGGFEAWSILRFGVFCSDSAGTIVSTPVDSTHWTGTELHHCGYLFLPPSGTNADVNWQGIGQSGTYGAVVDRPWISTNGANDYVLGSHHQMPKSAVGGAGVYSFAISVAPQGNGTSEVRFVLTNQDSSYVFAGKAIDSHSPLTTEKFNCVCFALNTTVSTTALNLTEVQVDLGESIKVPSWVTGVEIDQSKPMPKEYALSQNYPNPFNPTTQIHYTILKRSPVSLKVLDIPGREVATLFEGIQPPGIYTATFDGTGLAGGVYLCQLTANTYRQTRKIILFR
jgi:hypothetical protein